MKKIIVSILMIGALTIPASAKIKSKVKKTGHIPYHKNPAIDHSKDVAFSAQWADEAQSPAPKADFSADQSEPVRPYLTGGTTQYSLKNFTKHGAVPVSMNAPYQGSDAPSYDGAAKNAYRNMRANNESEPLPPNNGSK